MSGFADFAGAIDENTGGASPAVVAPLTQTPSAQSQQPAPVAPTVSQPAAQGAAAAPPSAPPAAAPAPVPKISADGQPRAAISQPQASQPQIAQPQAVLPQGTQPQVAGTKGQAAAAANPAGRSPRRRHRPPQRSIGLSSDSDAGSEDDPQRPAPVPGPAFDGKAEFHAVGRAVSDLKAGTDDLPSRLAFEQLNSLTDMGRRLQEQIEHSKAIFLRRVHAANVALLRKSFRAWQLAQFGSAQEQIKLRKALAKMLRFRLFRAWAKWREATENRGASGWMRNKIRAVYRKGCKRRVFGAWASQTAMTRRMLVAERNRLAIRAEIVQLCKANAVRLFVNRRSWRLFKKACAGWVAVLGDRRATKGRVARALAHWTKGSQASAYERWKGLYLEAKAQRAKVLHVMVKILKSKMARAFTKWFDDVVVPARHRTATLKKVLGKAQNSCVSRGFAKWKEEWGEAVRRTELMAKVHDYWVNRTTGKAWRNWTDKCTRRREFHRICDRVAARLRLRPLSQGWESWAEFVRLRRFEVSEEFVEAAKAKLAALEKENERLRRDNERFVRLIDSGQWSRSRVDELSKAGLTLQQERAELARLIGALQRGNKDWTSPLERNRLLIKGASSVQALQRALKGDLLESGRAAANPELLYAVDHLSFQKVSVVDDHGQVRVSAVHANGARGGLPRVHEEQRSSPLRPSSAQQRRPLSSRNGDRPHPLVGGEAAWASGRPQPPPNSAPPPPPPRLQPAPAAAAGLALEAGAARAPAGERATAQAAGPVRSEAPAQPRQRPERDTAPGVNSSF